MGGEFRHFLAGFCRGILGINILHSDVGVNFFEYLCFPERFADEIIGSDVDHFLAVFIHRTSRHRYNFRSITTGHGPDAADRFMAVHHRHAEVHENQMGLPLLKLKDGMLRGPNLGLLHDVCARTSAPVVASGGVASLADLRAIASLVPLGVEAAIVGTALCEGAFTLEEALAEVGKA